MGRINFGGQQRNIEAPCGFTIKGHPQETDKKIQRHLKYCKKCIEIRGSNKPVEIPTYENTSGMINGWNDYRGNLAGQEHMTTALIEGEAYQIHSKANTLRNAMKETKKTAYAIHQEKQNLKLAEHLRKVEEHNCEPNCDCKSIGKFETKEKLAEQMEEERINNGGHPDCPCCIITADRIVFEDIEGTNYCKVIVK